MEQHDSDDAGLSRRHLDPKGLLDALAALPEPEGQNPNLMLSKLLAEQPELEPYRNLIEVYRQRNFGHLTSHETAAAALGFSQALRLVINIVPSKTEQ